MTHFYDLVNENVDFENELVKLTNLLDEECYALYDSSTYLDAFDDVYRYLSMTGNSLSFRSTWYNLLKSNKHNLEQFCLAAEFLKTFVYQLLKSRYCQKDWRDQLQTIEKIIDFDLRACHCHFEFRETDDRGNVCFVFLDDVETALAVTRLTKKMDRECLLDYTRPTNKGNVDEKLKILKVLANVVEPIVQDRLFKERQGSLMDDVSFLLNNLNIRHANDRGKNKNDFIENATKKELEEVYDLTYRFMLDIIILAKEI